MKLDYFSLLSYEPIRVGDAGSVKSPTLKEISKIGVNKYNYLIAFLSMKVDTYYAFIDQTNGQYFANYSDDEAETIRRIRAEYEAMDDARRAEITFFNVLVFDKVCINTFLDGINFFFVEDFVYDDEHYAFVTYDVDENGNKSVSGYIDARNFSDVVSAILQRNGIEKKQEEKLKFKSKTAERIWLKTHKDKNKKVDKNMDLGNIISAVCGFDNSLNLINIWELTIFQLYDQFQRKQMNAYYDISSMSVAAWGDSNGNFDATQWYKNYRET